MEEMYQSRLLMVLEPAVEAVDASFWRWQDINLHLIFPQWEEMVGIPPEPIPPVWVVQAEEGFTGWLELPIRVLHPT
jgi:hypothetical protein